MKSMLSDETLILEIEGVDNPWVRALELSDLRSYDVRKVMPEDITVINVVP